MSQNDFNLANQGFPSMRSDMNSALQALASNSAGTSEPVTTYAYQWWYDSTNDILKIRNADNDAWIDFAAFDQVSDAWSFANLTIDGSVGIGTSSPSYQLEVANASGDASLGIISGNSDNSILYMGDQADQDAGYIQYSNSSDFMLFCTNNNQAMRLDSSGNVLIGKTSSNFEVEGPQLAPSGASAFTADASHCLSINRLTSDGDIIRFYKSSSQVGSIRIASAGFSIDGESGHTGIQFGAAAWVPRDDGANVDNAVDLGFTSGRFDDIYATNGTIQTSDEREKQDIAELDEAERRVAVACKGLLRKFRWKDAVAEKGDNARIHFGIIAQDLQAAFAAEGLDAGRYAMFIHTTWWESTEVIPAVAEELDENGNVITEAQPERTVTHTHETQEEAPEGAVQRDRMGVRYPELLAFIIAAM